MATRTTKKTPAKRAPRRLEVVGQATRNLTVDDLRHLFGTLTQPAIANPPFAMDSAAIQPMPETALRTALGTASNRLIDLGDSVSRLLHRLGDSVLGPPLPAPPGNAGQAMPEPATSRAVASINELADQIDRVHGLVREIHERLEA